MSHALRGGADSLRPLLDEFPELVNDVSTGGATPLHMCGMSQSGQKSTTFLIERGGEIEAIDTYGYRPIHRMASKVDDRGRKQSEVERLESLKRLYKKVKTNVSLTTL